MAWRPPFNENYGPPRRGRGVGGFVVPSGQGQGFPRGIGRGRPEMSPTTFTQGFGRHRYPFNNPYVAVKPAHNDFPQPKTDFSQLHPYHHHGHHQQLVPDSVDSDVNREIEVLQSVWDNNRFPDKKSKVDVLYKKLSSIVIIKSNPWESALSLITSTPDYELGKTVTLSFQILLQFQKWVQSSDNIYAGNEENYLSQEFRIKVFNATTGSHISYFNSAVEAFHLCHSGNEYFLPYAKALLLRDKLPEAVQVVSKLCLQSHFSREEILVPLLLTDRVNLLEMYIKGNSQQQMLILNLLDHLCARNTDILSFAQSTGVKNIKGEKWNKKSLSKFAVRLMKMFDIPPEMCPNISDNRAMSTVRFLLHKRYIEKSMTAECWDDMVESVIGTNTSLQQQFIMELMSYNDIQEAARWADRYRLPDSVLDRSVVEAKQNLTREESDVKVQQSQPSVSNKDEKDEEEDWDKQVSAHSDYYSIPLKDDAIVLVDSRMKLMAALERLTRPSTVIGIDCEWKPCGPSKQVALLQLAVEDQVFLIDFIQLESLVSDQDWQHFARSMFCDDRVLKIGFGLDTDLRMLSSSHPSMKEPFHKMVRVVEMSKLSKKIDDLVLLSEESVNHGVGGKTGNSKGGTRTKNHDVKNNEDDVNNTDDDKESVVFKQGVGFDRKNEEKGLSLLVKKVVGKALCKDEQLSNWEKRPLRRSQVLYAAIDAYVLLEVHNHLVSQAQALGLSEQEMEPPVIFKSKTRVERKKHKMNDSKRKSGTPNPSYPHASTRCRPHELRVVCDSMLQGLGSQLRACGVDAYILGTGALHEDAVQIALRENRIILTSGMPYEQVRSRVGDRLCYCVSHTLKSKDQCVDVLRHFKVDVNEDDIFSRCAVCNGAEFAHIPTVDMEQLYIINLQRNQQRMAYPMCHITDIDEDTKQMFSSTYGLDTSSLTFMHNGVRMQIETIPGLEPFQTIELFFVCVNCGKVYWKGSHFDRIQEQFKPVLTLTSQQNPADVVDFEDGYEDGYEDAGPINLQEAGFSGTWEMR